MKAVGLDAVEIDRIADAIERHGDRFLARIYTDAERQLADDSGEARHQFYAGRFAAKEAVLKALGTGYAEGLGFRDVEILRGDNGAPALTLHGLAGDRASALGISKILVSITHNRRDAHAVAVAE
jgi:holo-[acyl-carrier protein] synthase